jgi:hypothetical protein
MKTFDTKRIYSKEYEGDSVLIEICINEGITNIPAGTYTNQTNIASVIIPNTVKKIYGGVFRGCNELINVSIPDSIKYIGPCAFAACNKLTSIVIPPNVEELGRGIFWYCKNLSSITFLGQRINNSAFIGCRNITSLFIGENVMEIDPDIFVNCKKIKSLVVDDNNKTYDSRNNCNAIIETKSNTLILGCNTSKIPNGVKNITKRAFADCGRMRNITLPSTLEYIGSLPDSIQKIYIPKGTKDKFRQLLPRKKSKLIEQ